jgi:outer membrane protein
MLKLLPAVIAIFTFLLLFHAPSTAAGQTFDLQSVIQFALNNNPSLRIAEKNIRTETYAIAAARAERMPRVDFGSGATRFRYPTPLTPIVLSTPLNPLQIDLPDFEKTIFDGTASFRLPLYRGGRITRNIRIAEMRRALAQDNYAASSQELIYNLSSVYHKILQLQKLLLANEGSVRQYESHRNDVELFLKAGTVPTLDLLKTDVQLAGSLQNVLLVKNNLEAAFELLKTLMGVDEPGQVISITPQPLSAMITYPPEEEGMQRALAQRPDYRAVAKKKAIAEDRIRAARGKRLPDVYGMGQYVKRAGENTPFKEDWYLGLRLTIPVFDGGLISSEINREKTELEKVKEEERAVRQMIFREIKDAHHTITNASERMKVAEKAMASAKETLRVERLKYQTGAGTSTDIIDAQTALLRAETDHHQSAFDREIGLALLRKAMGEYPAGQEVAR